MDVGAVSRKEGSRVRQEAKESNLSLQTERMGQLLEILAKRPCAEYVERERSPGPVCFRKDRQEKAVVLDDIKISNGYKVCRQDLSGLIRRWSHHAADYRRRDVPCFREPAQEGILCPLRNVHKAIYLRDHFSFELSNPSEHSPVALDLLFVCPFVGHRDPEVDGKDYALMWSLSSAQGRPGSQWILGVNDAVANAG